MREVSKLPTGWKLALAALTAASAYNAVSLWRVSRPHAAATLVSPWVAPGDNVELDLVFERDPDVPRSTETEERVLYPVPRDAAIGSELDIDLQLNGPVAGRSGYEPSGSTTSNVLTLHVGVLDPASRTARRVASAFSGIACLALALLFSARVVEPRIRVGSYPRFVRIGVWAVTAPFLLFFVLKGGTQPIAAALVLGGTSAILLLSVAVVIAMIVFGKWACGPSRPSMLKGTFVIKTPDSTGGYRTLESAASEPSLAELASSIRRGPARASVKGRGVVARAPALSRAFESEVRITDAAGAAYAVRFNDSELLASVLTSLVPERGQIELEVSLGKRKLPYIITDASSAARFVRAVRAAQQEALASEAAQVAAD